MMIELESTGIKGNSVSRASKTNLNEIRRDGVFRGRFALGGVRCAARPGRPERHKRLLANCWPQLNCSRVVCIFCIVSSTAGFEYFNVAFPGYVRFGMT